MKIDEINKRINELETSIELLKASRQDFVENNKEEIFIKALNDGINYTTQRLDKYKTTEEELKECIEFGKKFGEKIKEE